MRTAAFVEAFSEQRLDDAAALLADDATTELVGSPFPPEQGREAIRAGSFAHMAAGDPPLGVEAVDDSTVWLTHGERGAVDVVIQLEFGFDERITKLRYHTLWHDRVFVESAAAARGRRAFDPDAAS